MGPNAQQLRLSPLQRATSLEWHSFPLNPVDVAPGGAYGFLAIPRPHPARRDGLIDVARCAGWAYSTLSTGSSCFPGCPSSLGLEGGQRRISVSSSVLLSDSNGGVFVSSRGEFSHGC